MATYFGGAEMKDVLRPTPWLNLSRELDPMTVNLFDVGRGAKT